MLLTIRCLVNHRIDFVGVVARYVGEGSILIKLLAFAGQYALL